jgi:uncharacterized protein (TIGR02271 family)
MPSAKKRQPRTTFDRSADRTVELRREELRPRPETVPAGDVRIRKEVVEDEVHAELPLIREELVIEREPIERRPVDREIGGGAEFRVTLREERVTLERRPVVTEQLRIRKRTVRETASVRGQARREEPVIAGEAEIQAFDRTRR